MSKITLARAISAFGRELGCSSDEDREFTLDHIQEALEWSMLNGAHGLLREWQVVARDGRFTLPRDLELPVKFKFSKLANQGFGAFHSSYFSFGSQGVQTCIGYNDWDTDISLRTNKTPVQYQPSCSVRLVLTTKNKLDIGKKVMVGGKQRGFDITPTHEGFKTSGELLTVYGEKDPNKKYSAYSFDEITSIVKEPTCDYVMLSGIASNGQMYHLSFFHPDDEVIAYTECEVMSCTGWNRGTDYELHILGRVNPSLRYIRDEDILPISSFELLKLLAKRARYDETGDYQEVGVIEQRLKTVIKRQVAYQQASKQGISIGLKASGASLTNL